MNGNVRFRNKGKLSRRYIFPYRVKHIIGQVAYEVELPPELGAVYPFFHVTIQHKCLGEPSHGISSKDIRLARDL